MREETNIGNWLTVSIPLLTPEDVMIMEAFQQRVLTERTVFLSYSRQDAAVAALLETELEAATCTSFATCGRCTRASPGNKRWSVPFEPAIALLCS